MRGSDEQPGAMFSYVSLEERVPPDHPLRAIRRITDRALALISPELGRRYIHFGRPSIPPERLRGPCCCRRCIRSAASAS
jgi:hypothetical protein